MLEPNAEDLNDTELARWLQEAGRRRVVRKPTTPLPQAIGTGPAPIGENDTGKRRYVRNPRTMTLLVIAALAYLPYFYADVYVQIATLPGVIVFV